MKCLICRWKLPLWQLQLPIAMQKVEGSSPFIRSGKCLQNQRFRYASLLLDSGQDVSIGYDRQGALDAGLSEGRV